MTALRSNRLRICLFMVAIGLLPGSCRGQDVPPWRMSCTQEEGYVVSDVRRIYAGRVGHMPGRWFQSVSPFYLERVRVGHYRWFPDILIPSEGADSVTLDGYIGRDVFILGRPASVDIHPDEPMAIASILGVVAESVIPVDNRQQEVILFPELPCSLGGDEIHIALSVTNALPYDLEAARLIVDVEGPYQFGGGGKERTYEQCKQWNEKLKGLEKREFEFKLVRADWPSRRDDTLLLMSVLFIGYARGSDGIEPICALWKNSWPVMGVISDRLEDMPGEEDYRP